MTNYIKKFMFFLVIVIIVYMTGLFDFASISYKNFEVTKDRNLIIYGNVTGWPYKRAMTTHGQFYTIGASIDVCQGSFCKNIFADKEYYNKEVFIENSLIKNKQMTYNFTFSCSRFSKLMDMSANNGNDLLAKVKITKYPDIFFNTEVSTTLPKEILIMCIK